MSKRSVRFGSGSSEMSGAKESKAVLSCEWPEERSALLAFLPSGSGKGTPESSDGQPEKPRPDAPPGSSAEKRYAAYLTNQRGES